VERSCDRESCDTGWCACLEDPKRDLSLEVQQPDECLRIGNAQVIPREDPKFAAAIEAR
jgi:hypothetical protein